MYAGLLLVLVAFELVATVWCLTRWQGVRKELMLMEKHYDALSDALRNAALSLGAPVNVDVDSERQKLAMLRDAGDDEISAAAETLSGASREQLDAAAKLLDTLGLNDKAKK